LVENISKIFYIIRIFETLYFLLTLYFFVNFSQWTFFGHKREKTTVCHGFATITTCWIPGAVEKSYLNIFLVFLTWAAIGSILAELLVTAAKQATHAFRFYASSSNISSGKN